MAASSWVTLDILRTILRGLHDDRAAALSAESVGIAVFSVAGAGASKTNEDAAVVCELAPGRLVAAVADGMGGGPNGAQAAGAAVQKLAEKPFEDVEPGLRGRIVDAFEGANDLVRERWPGGGTTLVAVKIVDRTVRSYHAGDSGAILVGSRGRVKTETMHHSPMGYAVAAGVLDRDDSLVHEDRSYLSNCLGGPDMRIEIGPPVPMAPRDTLLLASDGVLDNIRHDALIETIRRGPLVEAADALRDQIIATMRGENAELPAHPDDATAVLVRLRATSSRSRAAK